MDLFVSARADCIHKTDFDYCMKNWKTLPNETIGAWNHFERPAFRPKLIAEIKTIVDDERSPVPSEVPESILNVLKDESFHSITMLDIINRAEQLVPGNNERVLSVAKLLATYWMESSYLTQIVLSFVREPDSPRKMANTRNYFGVVFTMGEKLVEQKIFISFLLTKIDTVLRILVERDDARILKDVFPKSIVTLIERTYVRFCTGTYRDFLQATNEDQTENPFLVFTESLLSLCQRNFRIQRLLSGILIEISPPAQEKIMSSWFQLAPSTSIQSTVLFFPFATYHANASYEKTLLRTIPFDSVSNHSIKFWTNWADYVTSELELIPSVWETFMESFWELAVNVTNSASMRTPAFAFAGLAAAVKLKMADIPRQRVIKVTKALDKITNLMESVDVHKMHIAWALAHILFDLDRVQNEVKTGKPISRESIFDCEAEIFLQLVGFYEGKTVDEIRPPESHQVALVEEVPGEDDGQERFDEALDDRVRRLRTARLIPSSMLDVYHILVGDTIGSNDSETEALKQVAVLSIPILMASGVSVEPSHLERIGRILFEWGKDKDLDDFLPVALYELGMAYPDILSETLVKIIFNKNHGIGDKAQMLKVTEKILIYCGTNRCISCFSMYGPYKKDEMKKFISRMEPSFFPKYLYRNRNQPLCITCPPTPDEEPYETEESLTFRITNQNQQPLEGSETPMPVSEGPNSLPIVTAAGVPKVLRGPPPTRRWGIKRKENVQVVAAKKKTLHTSLWTAFHHHLLVESDLFLNQRSRSDGIQAHFLIQLLEFLRLLLMTYTGLSFFVQNIPKEAMQLIHIYGDHPNTNVRRALWSVLTELLQNTHISGELSLIEDEDPTSSPADLFSSHWDKENDPEVRDSIAHVRKLYKYQKFKRLNA